MHLTVTRAGLLTTVQDRGRPGHAHLAVPRSGAADEPSFRLANRLVGNDEGAAALETTLLGAAVRLGGDGPGRWVAVTGARCEVRIAGRTADLDRPRYVEPGQEIEVGAASRGLRAYLAVAGGVAVDPVLGSRARDTLNGIGPPPLTDGAELPLGPAPGAPAAVDVVPGASMPDDLPVRLVRGPRDDRFTEGSLAALTRVPYAVTSDSDRVGVRLDGPGLRRRAETPLPSEGIVLGAVQVPDDGRPLVFLADHPTTGGYPVVAVVHPSDLPAVAQARPGAIIRFRWTL